MRLVHAVHGFFPEGAGGVESYVRDIGTGQRAAGIDARLLTGSLHVWPEVGVENLELEGLPAWRVHRDDIYFDHYAKSWHPRVEQVITGLLRRERPDVLHVHQWIRLTSNLVEIAERLGIATVVTLHDLYTSCPRCFRVRPDDEACSRTLSLASCVPCVPRFGHESEREVAFGIELFRDQYLDELSRARAVLVANEATAELISATTGFDRRRFELLPLAYPPRFAGRRPPPPAADAPFRFGYWGNLTARKGAPVLVEAFARMLAVDPSQRAELHLFGGIDTPELERRLRQLAADLPVTFHGRFDYEQLETAGLHLAVFPMTCFETYGFVLDEAFELGLPAIVTDLGAMPRRAGRAALAVPPNDVAALAAAMTRIVTEAGLRDELASHVPAPGLSLAGHLDRLRAVYEEVRAAGPRAVTSRIPSTRRAELLALQRESALSRICPPGGPR